MRPFVTYPLLTAFLVAGCSAGAADKPTPAAQATPAAPQTDDSKVFYALGVFLSQRVASFNLTPEELEQVKKGLTDGTQGKAGDFQPEPYMARLQELNQQRMTAVAEREKTKGKEYASTAAKEAGAVQAPSGLVFVSLKAGDGASPTPQDTVKVHYKGTLIDGKEFDSSYQRGAPAEFGLSGVIPCWTEGVQKMKVGGKAKLVCPSSIAYGDGGRPPKIPGGATLVFEVELVEVKAAAAKPEAPKPEAPKPVPTPKS